MSGTWEIPRSPSQRVGCTNPIEGHLTARGESDRSIVLRGGSADHMGKGATGLCSPQRKHEPGLLNRRFLMPTSLRGIAIICGSEQS